MIGETLSHYRITGHLGAGGMGEVYKAEDTKLGREVAIKVLQTDVARDTVRLERFSREARAVASLNHPNIVTIYSVEEADGKHFITMELVEGETLDERIAEGGLPLNRLFDIVLPLADALRSAHEKGIVHRDLKPANVMLTDSGTLKVLDFGLAKLQDTDSDIADAETVSRLLTQDGTVLGTYPYMSPEQVEGKHLDQRTDLFSLGTMVYELATGNRPFAGDSSPALMSSILRDEPGALTEIRPDLPRHLNRIVCRCLEKNPRDRYQSARSLYNELKGLRRESVSDASSVTSSVSYGRARQSAKLTWIAVLPIKVTGNDQGMQDFADGLAEDVTAGLSKFPYLSIVARESTLKFARQSGDIREVSEQLGARYVIDGGIRKAGSTIRVSMRLVDAHSGTNLWVESYTRNTDAQDIFATQDDITERVVATVADGYGVLARSMIEEIEDKADEDLTSAEWMLRTFDYLSQMTPESHDRTRAGLQQAVKRFSRQAEVWACLAQVFVHEYNFLFNPQQDPLDRALKASEKSIELDRTCQFGYQMLAQTLLYRRDLAAFRAAAERAISLNPLDSNTLGILGIFFSHTGDFERGAELTRRAMKMNPHHAGWYHFGPLWLHFSAGEYEKSLGRANQINMPGLFWTHLVTASICGHLGRAHEAKTAVRKLLELDPDFGNKARQSIEVWHFASGLMDSILDGLRKAGLEMPDDASDDSQSGPAAVETAPTRPADAVAATTGSAVAIAVLPFADMSPAKDQEFFCEGMAEEIMNALMQVKGIRVASRLSAFAARQEGKDLAAIGRALSVGEVLEGSVRVAGDRLRVTAQLTDVVSGYQLWSERYDRDTTDIFAVQDEIAQSVVKVVQARLSPGAAVVRDRQKVNNLDAYRHYLKGRYFRYTKNDHASAIREYEQSVELDASYGPAWTGLADATVLAAGYGLIPTQEAHATARDALATAETLQGESAEALYVKGALGCLQWDWDAARDAFERAVNIRPDHVQSLGWFGFFLSLRQRPDEARIQFELARESDPLAAWAFAMTACGLTQMSQLNEALPFAEQAVALDDTNTLAAWILGMILITQGRHDEGILALERATEMGRRGAFILGILGWGLAAAGRREDAESVLAELRARGGDAPTTVSEVWLLAVLGHMEDAWRALAQVQDQAQMMLLFVGFPAFDPLRDDPRFTELLTRMGLPAPPVRRSDTTRTPASTVTAASETHTITDAGNVRSILALPARLHGPDAEPYLADAIPMTLSTNLAEIEGLEIKLPPSSHETKRLGDSPEKLAAAYGVDALVLSSVMASPRELVINLQLAEGHTRRVLWSHQFTGTQSGYIDLLREAAEGLRTSLRRKPVPASTPRHRISSEAELALRRGQYYSARFNHVHDRKDYEIARKAFEHALDLEPQFAECAGELAWLHVPLVEAGEPQAADQIEQWGRRAIEMDPQCGSGLVAMAWWSVISGQIDDHSALDYALRAVAADPRDGRAHLQVAFGLMAPSGSVQLYADAAIAASEQDPLYLYPMICAAIALSALGRSEEALQINRRALDLEPDMPAALMADVYALCEQRRYEEAKSLIERMAAHAKAGRLIEEWYRVPMHVLNLHTGDRSDRAETANALRDEVRQAGHGFTRHMVLWHAVPLLAAKGDTESCFDLLELLSESRSLAYDHLVNHKGFESLRDDVRFQKLLQDSRAEFEDKLLVIDAAAAREELPEYIAKRLPKLRAKLQQKLSPARPPSFVNQSDIRMSQPGRFDRVAPASPDSTTGDSAPRSLAVLPLANLSGDPEQEFFVAGMHDALINELARLKALTVISRTSTMPFAGSTEPLPEIATRLGVEAVIEGSVLKAGNQVRINLQLVNAHPEKHLWADSFDGAMEDILDLHRRVAGEVSSAVRARLTANEEERLETTRKVDPQVYEIYLRARHVNVFVADDNWRGIRLYEEATARDPEFAPAYAGMARNYVYLATLGAAAPGDVLPLAAEAAQRAIELDPESGEARSIHGYTKLFLEWDWNTAGDEMKLAREMEPNNVAALCDSVLFLALTGSVDESVRIADRIVELDPISADALFWQGWARFLAERYEEAIEILHASIAANPAVPYSPLWIGAAYGMMGMAGEALTWARKAEALDPKSRNTDFLAVLGATYVMGGERDETRRVLQRVVDLQTDDVRFPTQQGYLHGWLGEYDEAVEFYKIAFAERNPGVIFLGNHPVCDKPRSDPRILKMIEEMGFPAIRPMLSLPTDPGNSN